MERYPLKTEQAQCLSLVVQKKILIAPLGNVLSDTTQDKTIITYH